MNIAALTLVRNDSYFLQKWVAYYGAAIGLENLFVICRGSDWPLPDLPPQVSRIVANNSPSSRYQRNEWSAAYVSDVAAFLLTQYDAVIRADTDEFIVVDPDLGMGLAEAIEQSRELGCVSALGTDVIQHLDREGPLDTGAPVLAQRRHGVVTREFSKPVIIHHPVRWTAGFHAASQQFIQFGAGLHLFHLALHDQKIAQDRIAERSGSATSESLLTHIKSRIKRFDEVTLADPIPGDAVYDKARAQISAPRPRRGPRTRPGFITDGNNVERGYLIKIPDRFAQVL